MHRVIVSAGVALVAGGQACSGELVKPEEERPDAASPGGPSADAGRDVDALPDARLLDRNNAPPPDRYFFDEGPDLYVSPRDVTYFFDEGPDRPLSPDERPLDAGSEPRRDVAIDSNVDADSSSPEEDDGASTDTDATHDGPSK